MILISHILYILHRALAHIQPLTIHTHTHTALILVSISLHHYREWSINLQTGWGVWSVIYLVNFKFFIFTLSFSLHPSPSRSFSLPPPFSLSPSLSLPLSSWVPLSMAVSLVVIVTCSYPNKEEGWQGQNKLVLATHTHTHTLIDWDCARLHTRLCFSESCCGALNSKLCCVTGEDSSVQFSCDYTPPPLTQSSDNLSPHWSHWTCSYLALRYIDEISKQPGILIPKPYWYWMYACCGTIFRG